MKTKVEVDKCPYCKTNKFFVTRFGLSAHIRKYHPKSKLFNPSIDVNQTFSPDERVMSR